jgi:hypothetical protein
MGEEMDGAMQHAPQPGRQAMGAGMGSMSVRIPDY